MEFFFVKKKRDFVKFKNKIDEQNYGVYLSLSLCVCMLKQTKNIFI